MFVGVFMLALSCIMIVMGVLVGNAVPADGPDAVHDRIRPLICTYLRSS